jgi:hypothetical protein
MLTAKCVDESRVRENQQRRLDQHLVAGLHERIADRSHAAEHADLHSLKTLEGFARLFLPRYALANLGRPSYFYTRPFLSVLL